MIKLASIVPHPLVLIPTIGKENTNLLESTAKAYQKLEKELTEEKIDTIVIISSHGPIRSDIWSINLSEKFEINFEEFGDFSTKFELPGDLGLAQDIRESFSENKNVQLINYPNLDHGSGVPLYLLCLDIKDIKIVPIYVSGANLKKHFDFGKLLAKKLSQSPKQIALVASGDLSHRLNKKAPAGYSPKAAKFDQKLVEAISGKKPEEILNINEGLLEEVRACGPKSIAVLLGALEGIEYDPKILSYESPFGIGNLTAQFKILS